MKYALTALLAVIFLNCAAQGNFITAGQTQDMIYTEFEPDYYFRMNAPGLLMDLNWDGEPDLGLYAKQMQGGVMGGPYYIAFGGLVLDVYGKFFPDDTIHNISVSKKFQFGDTMLFNAAGEWDYGNDSFTEIAVTCYPVPSWWCAATDTSIAILEPAYYFVKVITPPDTSYGYIHLRIDSALNVVVYDYACQGNEALHTIDPYAPIIKTPSVFPVPFLNYLTVQDAEGKKWIMIDVLGQTVLELHNGINDTGKLRRGTYFIKEESETPNLVRKVIKL